MKKALVFVSLLAVIAALAMPGVVGHFLERELAEQRDVVQQIQPGIDLTTGHVSRGWFGSAIVHEVHFADGQALAPTVEGLAAGGTTLVLESDVRHGLALFSGGPALAVATSRATLRGPGGDTLQLPGRLVTRIGFSGGAHARFTTSDVTVADGQGGQTTFGQTDMSARFNREFSAVRGGGDIESLAIGSPDGVVEGGPIAFDFDLARDAASGLWEGEYSFEVDRLQVSDVSGDGGEITGLVTSARVAIDDDLLNAGGDIAFDRVLSAGFDASDIRLTMHMEKLDVPGITALQAAVAGVQRDQAAGGNPPATDPQRVEAMIMGPIMDVFRRGPRLNIERLEVSLPDGPFAMNLDVALEEMTPGTDADLVAVLENAVGEGRLLVAKPVAQMLGRLNPQTAQQIQLGLATGFLIDTGDSYRVDLAYADGVLTVNGNPVPLPLDDLVRQ